jgi:iron complex outermembrane receptor protein
VKKRLLFLGFLLVFLFAPLCWAEDPEKDKSSITTMEEVVVTATRSKQEIKRVPANVTVITEADILKSTAQNIGELLKTAVGIKVNDITGNRRSYTVDLRGFGETAALNTLVLVDGRRVNQADLSGTDWIQIPLDRVAKIEIIRGGQGSVLYGDNASGGVVNIITKEGDRFAAGVEGALGSYDTYKGNAYVSGTSKNVSYALTGSYLNSSGYRDNSDQESKDFGLNLKYDASDILGFNFSTGFHKDDTGLPGGLTESDFAAGASRTDTKNPNDFAEVEDYYFKLTPEFFFLEDNVFKIDLSYRKRDSLSFSSFIGGNSFTGDTRIKTFSVSPQVIIKNQLWGIDNSFTLGFDYENINEDIVNDLFFPPYSSLGNFSLQRKSYGYYLYDKFNLGSDLFASLGYRYDKADFDFDQSVTPGPPPGTESTSADEEAYTAGINYVFYKKSYAYFSFSKSFRYPVLDEFFSYVTNSVNSAFKPQRSKNYELGTRYFFNDQSYVHLNFFRMETTDEIYLNPTILANDNLDGKTRRDGLELAFNLLLAKWLSFNGNYAYTDAKILDGQFKEKDIPDVPNHQAALGASFYWKKAVLAVNGVYVGERPFISDFSNSFSNQEDYLIFNLKLKYTWNKITAFMDVNNLTDEEYSEYGAITIFSFPKQKGFYPSPKRNFLVGLRIDF